MKKLIVVLVEINLFWKKQDFVRLENFIVLCICLAATMLSFRISKF